MVEALRVSGFGDADAVFALQRSNNDLHDAHALCLALQARRADEAAALAASRAAAGGHFDGGNGPDAAAATGDSDGNAFPLAPPLPPGGEVAAPGMSKARLRTRLEEGRAKCVRAFRGPLVRCF